MLESELLNRRKLSNADKTALANFGIYWLREKPVDLGPILPILLAAPLKPNDQTGAASVYFDAVMRLRDKSTFPALLKDFYENRMFSFMLDPTVYPQLPLNLNGVVAFFNDPDGNPIYLAPPEVKQAESFCNNLRQMWHALEHPGKHKDQVKAILDAARLSDPELGYLWDDLSESWKEVRENYQYYKYWHMYAAELRNCCGILKIDLNSRDARIQAWRQTMHAYMHEQEFSDRGQLASECIVFARKLHHKVRYQPKEFIRTMVADAFCLGSDIYYAYEEISSRTEELQGYYNSRTTEVCFLTRGELQQTQSLLLACAEYRAEYVKAYAAYVVFARKSPLVTRFNVERITDMLLQQKKYNDLLPYRQLLIDNHALAIRHVDPETGAKRRSLKSRLIPEWLLAGGRVPRSTGLGGSVIADDENDVAEGDVDPSSTPEQRAVLYYANDPAATQNAVMELLRERPLKPHERYRRRPGLNARRR